MKRPLEEVRARADKRHSQHELHHAVRLAEQDYSLDSAAV
jgi:hypothetical protein